MDTLLPLVSLTAVAVITPGPNNVVVMTRGAASGFCSAAPSILGILIGVFAMTVVTIWAAGSINAGTIARYVVWAGALSLAAMAVSIWRDAGQGSPGAALLSPAALAAFQFANPKAWITSSTVAATAAVAGLPSATVLKMTVLISALGLSAWALGGAMLSTWLSRGGRRRVFERVLAISLFLSAVALLFL